jgi:hypothetical protein
MHRNLRMRESLWGSGDKTLPALSELSGWAAGHFPTNRGLGIALVAGLR